MRLDTPVATSTPNTQILISNINLQNKEPGLLGELADTTDHTSKLQDELGTSCSTRKQRSTQRMMGVNGHRWQHEKTIIDHQTRDQLQHSRKENNSLTKTP